VLTVSGRLCAVLGWPLGHTLSPAMHNAAFAELGIDVRYIALRVRPGELADALAGLRALEALGANVTMPHKEAAAALMDELSPTARDLDAVNTISFVERRTIGDNTDASGLRAFLVSEGVVAGVERAVVLGAGGAGRAVVAALDALGLEGVIVAARRHDEARRAAHLGLRAAPVDWGRATEEAARADLVVNATPVGTDGKSDPLPGVAWAPGQRIVDLVYGATPTPLVTRARERGAHAWDGVGMLVHQGAESLRIWTGRAAPLDVMKRAALEGIARIAGPGRDDLA
jgi:shikimate dehydrogenase